MDIFVGNLPYEVEESALEAVFAAHGAVARVKMLTDRETGRPRGIAFVTMDDVKEGQAAIEALDGHELGGRPMKVNEARPRSESSGPRHGSGGNYRGGGGGNFNRGGGGGFRGRDRY